MTPSSSSARLGIRSSLRWSCLRLPGSSPWVPIVVNMALSGDRAADVPARDFAWRREAKRFDRRRDHGGRTDDLALGCDRAVRVAGGDPRCRSNNPRCPGHSASGSSVPLRGPRRPGNGHRLIGQAFGPFPTILLAAILVLGLWKTLGPRCLGAAALVVALTAIPYFWWTNSNERNFGVATYSSLGNFQLTSSAPPRCCAGSTVSLPGWSSRNRPTVFRWAGCRAWSIERPLLLPANYGQAGHRDDGLPCA